MGESALGFVTAHNYSASHPSDLNAAFVKAFKASNPGMRPDFTAVHTYDAMALVFGSLIKTNGDTNGDKLLAAMKGMSFESPRGPISIDPVTRDIVQNIYIREVKKGPDGELYNMEFATFKDVKDPVKAAALLSEMRWPSSASLSGPVAARPASIVLWRGSGRRQC
jgi:branched-chain amino acid transport system substrate-binding protein